MSTIAFKLAFLGIFHNLNIEKLKNLFIRKNLSRKLHAPYANFNVIFFLRFMTLYAYDISCDLKVFGVCNARGYQFVLV